MCSRLNRQLSFVLVFTAFVFSANIGFSEEKPVEFADANLKKAVEKELRKQNPTPADMLQLRQFSWVRQGLSNIHDLKGLEHAKNLTSLSLNSCSIQDYSILSNLNNLTILTIQSSPVPDYSFLLPLNNLMSLKLDSCGILDLSSLVSVIETLPKLEYLSLVNNEIEDITPLAKMTKLENLWLSGNKITDISPLLPFKNLERLGLYGNPMDEGVSKVHLQKIRKNNPGIYIPTDFNPEQLIWPGIVALALAAVAIFLIFYLWTEKGWVLELIAGLISTGVGAFFGRGAQELYTSGGEIPLFGNGYENPMWVGGVAGGVFGLLAGVWFAQHLRQLLSGGHEGGELVGRGVFAGIVLGILCSMVVHVLLMTAYRNLNFWPMVIGLGFGIAGGIAAGLVISVVFIASNKIGLIKIKEAKNGD